MRKSQDPEILKFRVLLLLLALATPAALDSARARVASAQDNPNDPLRTYRAAVVLYQGKQADAALRLAGTWKPESVRRDVPRRVEERDGRLAAGVALLMTELAWRDLGGAGAARLGLAELIVEQALKELTPSGATSLRDAARLARPEGNPKTGRGDILTRPGYLVPDR